MSKKTSKKQIENFEPTKVALMVASVAVITIVLFALLGLEATNF